MLLFQILLYAKQFLIYRKLNNSPLINYLFIQFSSIAQSRLTLCDPMGCSTPGLLVYHQHTGFTQIHVHWVGDAIHLMLCCPLLLLPSIFPSSRIFSNESVLHIRWPKYWSFNLSISPSNEYSGLISLRMDCLNLLQSKGLSRIFSNTSSKASILQHSAFFIVQRSYPYKTTGKNHNFD